MQKKDSSDEEDNESFEKSFYSYMLYPFQFPDQDYEQVRVEFFTNERSIKERLHLYFIKNQRSSLRIRIFNFIIKLLTCILYVIRVMMDNPSAHGQKCFCTMDSLCNHTYSPLDSTEPIDIYKIHWTVILFVNRNKTLWIIQVIVAIISLLETLLVTYLGYKGNILYNIFAPSFLLELMNTVPFIITIFSADWRCLFIPVFFNCWLAKQQLEQMFGDLNRVLQRTSSALAQRLMNVTSTTACLIFTSVCGIQHLQRGGNVHFDLFESFWFVMVTFSTVGYGDYKPDVWPSQLFMIIMICVAITVLPLQIEKLAFVWVERNRMGGTYSRHRAQNERHVVLCTTTLHADTIMDFLNEFYAHPKLQDFYVILFSPCELDSTMKIIMQVPIWALRVIYIQGSALKDSDLARCRMQDAEACFILCPRNYQDRNAADQHTILRSWAVKDFAPHCPQYVQIYRPENKIHVRFAEYVVCEDEFKYAVLANNCLCPGTSTLVTLLLHTSRGQEGQHASEDWMRLYGKCSGNEIYHIKAGESRFFGEYVGKSFTYASFHAHRKYGVALVAVQSEGEMSHILLNPGPRHVMQSGDMCFYMSITKEENTTFVENPSINDKGLDRGSSFRFSKPSEPVPNPNVGVKKLTGFLASLGTNDNGGTEKTTNSNSLDVPGALSLNRRGSTASIGGRRSSIAPVPALDQALASDQQVNANYYEFENGDFEETEETATLKEFPPVLPYVGNTLCLSHILKNKRNVCCLNLSEHCEHCYFNSAKDYNWANKGIIVCSDFASNGLYNFILPLMSHWRPKQSLRPIVLLLEKTPDRYFLEAISYFPMVYWMIGSIDNIDDLLRAGILYSDSVVIVNRESSNAREEETLSDCNTIIAVQTIFKLFPNTNIITELSQSSNMRFTQFKANDPFQMSMSKIEKRERERGSHMSYMFRMGFAAGTVFSASMLDTLLYQAFVKEYLITFVRLLLGIDQARGSGHLTCMQINTVDLWIKTYGRLYQKLCASSCEIPIGIYRTFTKKSENTTTTANPNEVRVDLSVSTDNDNKMNDELLESREISHMIGYRMDYLNMHHKNYNDVWSNKKREVEEKVSYVIINPSNDLKLEPGDIIYLIGPSSLSPEASPLVGTRRADQSKPAPEKHRHKDCSHHKPAATSSDKTSTQSPQTSASLDPAESIAAQEKKSLLTSTSK